jgi:hypothetical protein
MSETIAEMVLPGTYIEVRAEGLIAVGSIATGNVGIVGTAAKGPVGTAVPIGGAAEAIDVFGPADQVSAPAETGAPLSLVRAMQQVFAGGGSNLAAVRIAGGTPQPATLTVPASTGNAFLLTAADPSDPPPPTAPVGGSWGNGIRVVVVDNGSGATPRFRMTLSYRSQREVFEGSNVSQLRAALEAPGASGLVRVSDPATDQAGSTANLVPLDKTLAGGTSVPAVNATHVAAGLAALEDQNVNIVTVAGLGASVVTAPLLAHLTTTVNEGQERIAIIGASSSDATTVLNDAGGVADGRVVLVAPGVRVSEPGATARVALPPSATAAIVAGRLAALPPHISLTNQTLPIEELDQNYSTTVHRNLLLNRVLTVRRRFGHQIVRGISTDPGAFSQISVRRTVDYAKAGTRLGANPYIGKLNNARVRAALKATLDGFFSQMVLDEMLTGYQLDVSATRAQEIRGICTVIVTMQPTFSIDFIRVTMNLE